MMVKNKKFVGGALVIAGVAMLLAFQNCSQNASLSSTLEGSINGSSSTDLGTGIVSSDLTYPSTTSSIILKAGQKITLKFPTPSFPESSANYMWYAFNDGHMLMAKYGLPVFVNGYMYISLSVRSDMIVDQSAVRLMLYNFVNTAAGYLDQKGVKIYLTASSGLTSYSIDSLADACTSSTAYGPAFKMNRTAVVEDALIVTDNGGGIASATCTFNNVAADCFKTSTWPAGWATQTVVVSATSRCGTTNSVTLTP